MANFQVKFGGEKIKTPINFRISRFNLTKSGRVTKGDMKMELVAKKRKFEFAYDVLSGPDLDLMLKYLDSQDMFFRIDYVENGVAKFATVYVGEVAQDRFRTDGIWYWKDVKFNLIEQ